ncbi:MAG: RNA polymerase sigma factor, partial [Pyrinomonadaceae bacterium]
MLKPRRISTTHRDAFLKRYDGLHAWAVQMTGGDKALAEDLLHDLFILFTLSQPDLSRIQNLDNYLYASLRNLHISQLRRTTRGRFEQLSVVEYESARLSLHSLADRRDLIQAQDELRRVCHYACTRKESANAASVLLLRFFHGYYPSEIARVVRSTRTAVDKRLHAARVEAKTYLENANSLAFLQQPNEPAIPNVFPVRFATAAGDFLLELQQTIFRSRQGECLSREELKHLYETDRPSPIARKLLAHVASCPVCLDSVNNLLGLPKLSERYPTDTMDKDNKKGGGPTDGGNKGDAVRKLSDWEREAREIFEHKPQELCVSVNGYLLGAQLIGSELSEFTLNVTVDERISFCEVFSEQGLRLLMMNVENSPPNGPGELHQRVELSEARSLESSLLFSNPFPTLHVTYHDPALASEAVALALAKNSESECEPTTTAQSGQPNRKPFDSSSKKPDQRIRARIQGFLAHFFHPRFWLRPETVTVLFAIFLVTIGLFISLHRIPTQREPSAAEILQ